MFFILTLLFGAGCVDVEISADTGTDTASVETEFVGDAGVTDISSSEPGVEVVRADDDFDGSDASDDCDDTNPAVHPDAVECLNGLDDDCDGVIDEDAVTPSTWYLDADSDGYGDGSITTTACSQPVGYADNGFDCNDADPAIYRGCGDPVVLLRPFVVVVSIFFGV